MPRITRKIEFDAGHRVVGHESKCAHLHGHRYVAEVTVQACKLDEIGRVVDFSCIKTVVGSWIDDNWDHNMILNVSDPLISRGIDRKIFGDKDPYLMSNGNPTAENMAEELFKVAKRLLVGYGVEVVHVRIYETPNCWSDYEG
jgi:6-pyruvoyltetrahydropterin/6-carboxytetrahydropterin synthase